MHTCNTVTDERCLIGVAITTADSYTTFKVLHNLLLNWQENISDANIAFDFGKTKLRLFAFPGVKMLFLNRCERELHMSLQRAVKREPYISCLTRLSTTKTIRPTIEKNKSCVVVYRHMKEIYRRRK